MADVNNLQRNKSGLDYDYGEMSLNPRRQVGICSDLLLMTVVGFFYNYVITCNHCVSFTADVNFTSLVTSLITCHHCVSLTPFALVICKLQRILKGFTSLVAQRVFTSVMRIIQPANRGLACHIACCRSAGHTADYFRLQL